MVSPLEQSAKRLPRPTPLMRPASVPDATPPRARALRALPFVLLWRLTPLRARAAGAGGDPAGAHQPAWPTPGRGRACGAAGVAGAGMHACCYEWGLEPLVSLPSQRLPPGTTFKRQAQKPPAAQLRRWPVYVLAGRHGVRQAQPADGALQHRQPVFVGARGPYVCWPASRTKTRLRLSLFCSF